MKIEMISPLVDKMTDSYPLWSEKFEAHLLASISIIEPLALLYDGKNIENFTVARTIPRVELFPCFFFNYSYSPLPSLFINSFICFCVLNMFSKKFNIFFIFYFKLIFF
jgi:hypothetical protein